MARFRSFDAARPSQQMAPELNDVRMRRAGLKAAMSGLELALAAAAPARADWVDGVRGSLNAVHEVWTRHVVETEAPGAFLDEIVDQSQRLSKPASRLRREHSDILAAIVRAEKKLVAPPGDDTYDDWSDEIRAELTTLLVSLARHRQRGADLVYEAYAVDLGGG
jgi:hypothetical protein